MATSSASFDKNGLATQAHSDETDNQMVARIRLMLALSALLVAIVDYIGPGGSNKAALLVLTCYAGICTVAYVCTRLQLKWPQGKLMHRLDALMCAAMVTAGGQADVFPLVFLFFSIVVASLRYGLEEGARVTIVAVMLYCIAVALAMLSPAEPRLFLRAAVLLAFGRAIAQLGERHVQGARREALLRELNQVSNPRFGIDRTMTAALDHIRAYFRASSCFTVLEDSDTGTFAVRARRGEGPMVSNMEPVSAGLARAMLPEPRAHVQLYVGPRTRRVASSGAALTHPAGPGRWVHHDGAPLRDLAELLEAGSFISAPLVFGRSKGRIYVTAARRQLGRSDALFLARIAAQELHVIDCIDLLDRIASDAATLERKKIALDLHDTAIQSYIGLQLGLVALCRRAAPSNPLTDELGKLVDMAAEVVVQLRDFAQRACGRHDAGEPIFLTALRRQAAQAMTAYGVDVRIDIDGPLEFGDRLTAEVLQIVREGISNVCRHTPARRAAVMLRCSENLLRIEINNEHGGVQPPPFRPHSISERATALGGAAFVCQGRFNDTIVCVEIPL